MKELIVVAQDITRYGLDLYGRRTLAQLLPKLCAIEGIQWSGSITSIPMRSRRAHRCHRPGTEDREVFGYSHPAYQRPGPPRHASPGDGAGDSHALSKAAGENPRPGPVHQLIAGFPGETEEEFEELCEFLLAFRVERAGVFPYSPEPGSAAAAFPDQVDEDVKRRRVELLTDLQMRIVDDYCGRDGGQSAHGVV